MGTEGKWGKWGSCGKNRRNRKGQPEVCPLFCFSANSGHWLMSIFEVLPKVRGPDGM